MQKGAIVVAKYECTIPNTYDFDAVLQYFHEHLSNSSSSASYEDGSDYRSGAFRVAVRVYEKFSFMGDNRLSMTVTLASNGNEIFASAITAAGGGGLVKIWGWGENSYLEHFISAAKQFEGMTPYHKPS